jgi:hypothetical protein
LAQRLRAIGTGFYGHAAALEAAAQAQAHGIVVLNQKYSHGAKLAFSLGFWTAD